MMPTAVIPTAIAIAMIHRTMLLRSGRLRPRGRIRDLRSPFDSAHLRVKQQHFGFRWGAREAEVSSHSERLYLAGNRCRSTRQAAGFSRQSVGPRGNPDQPSVTCAAPRVVELWRPTDRTQSAWYRTRYTLQRAPFDARRPARVQRVQ